MSTMLERLRAHFTPVSDEELAATRKKFAEEAEARMAAEREQYRTLFARLNPEPTPAELAMDPARVYLLFRNEQDVEWSTERDVLDRALTDTLANGSDYAINKVFEVEVAGWVAARLATSVCPSTGIPRHSESPGGLPAGVREAAAKRMTQPVPDWRLAEGHRAFVVFSAEGYCAWSPSGNNLTSIVERSLPRAYLGEPLRVNLTREEEALLFAYTDWFW